MQIEVYLPEATRQRVPGAEERTVRSAAPAQPPKIKGNVFAVIKNGWRSMDVLSDAVADRLRELGAREVLNILVPEGAYAEGAKQQLAPSMLDDIAGRVDGAVFGLGN